eukprot:COSAG02_NODE_208_length_29027_cov_27.870230_11_plen_93_part_00
MLPRGSKMTVTTNSGVQSTMAETDPAAIAPVNNPMLSPLEDDALSTSITDDLEQALNGEGVASGVPPAMIETAVQTVFGRLTMAPTNWHQVR